VPALELTAQVAPHASAIISSDATYTYAQLRQAVAATARALPGALYPNHYAVTPLPISTRSLILLMALWRKGAIACPVDPRLPSEAVNGIMNKLGPAATLLDDVQAVTAANGAAKPQELSEDAPAVVIATSGSSGEPKLALLSYANLYHSGMAANRNMPLAPGDRWLLSLPLHHVAGIGIVFRCLISGAAVVVPDTPRQIAETIVRHNVTHVSLVSTQLYRLMREPEALAALKRLRAILLGGGPMPAPLIQESLAHGLPICTSYGLTETASQITATRPGDPPDALSTSGAELTPGTVSVSDDGEILVRGKTLFQGYFRNGNIERPLTPEGWFPTGDLGRFDSNARLTVLGRQDNMFVSSGENVYPEEIERALEAIPGILQAVVVPVEDPERGHVPVAYLRLEANQIVHPDDLVARLSEVLPRYKIPRQFHPWPAHLPDAAKVNRRSINNPTPS